MIDGFRLAVGTLSVFPIAPPRTVDRNSAGWAMTLAPLVGALLAVVALLLQWLLGWSPFRGTEHIFEAVSPRDLLSVHPAPPLVVSALTIGLLALMTRAMHLDGLADTADGLGSGRPAAAALEIMRKGDVGPFGVATVTLVLFVQLVALAHLVAIGRGPVAIALALAASRLVLPLVCSRGIPSARADGLGQAVAGSVSRLQLLGAGLGCVTLMAFVLMTLGAGTDLTRASLTAVVAAAVALLAGAAFCWRCVHRLGGVSGDVMGACVEVTFTVALVVLTML